MKKASAKIHVTKNDDIASIVERIMDAPGNEVTLSVPRFARFAESLSNFNLLKREAALLKKKVIIESVDEDIIELAESAGFSAVNPILSKRVRRTVSDIVSSRPLSSEASPRETLVPRAPLFSRRVRIDEAPPEPARKKMRSRSGGGKNLLYGLLGIAGVGLVLFIMFWVLPSARISLSLKRSSWNLSETFAFDKSQGTAQLFSSAQNVSLSFPASGSKDVSTAATGVLTIYNAYSSSPQPLVASTRFITSDGKVYRLTQSVTVPGAKIVEGKIVPSTIDAEARADKPGEAHNIGPTPYLSIPGFKGTPKYEGFYAEARSGMQGGFVGRAAVPTSSDIEKGKAVVVERLTAATKTALYSQLPKGFRIVDGASRLVFGKQSISQIADASGNFTIFMEATMRAIAFKDVELEERLVVRMRKEKGSEYAFATSTLVYGTPVVDFEKGILRVPLSFGSSIVKPIDTDGVLQMVAGKSVANTRLLLLGLPGLEKATISLSPPWVFRLPPRASRILLDVE